MYCKKCGTKIEKVDKFCPKCGTSTEEESVTKKYDWVVLFSYYIRKPHSLFWISMIVIVLIVSLPTIIGNIGNYSVSKDQIENSNDITETNQGELGYSEEKIGQQSALNPNVQYIPRIPMNEDFTPPYRTVDVNLRMYDGGYELGISNAKDIVGTWKSEIDDVTITFSRDGLITIYHGDSNMQAKYEICYGGKFKVRDNEWNVIKDIEGQLLNETMVFIMGEVNMTMNRI